MKKIAITGLSGVIGSALIKNFPKKYEIVDLYSTNKTKISGNKTKHVKLNLADTKKIKQTLGKINPDIVLHMAAITHIDRCEKDKEKGVDGEVWKINVSATEEIAQYCKENNKKIIFLSTECVFDGKKKFFKETDKTNPINWYGVTKNEAEKNIYNRNIKSAIIRAVVTYKKDDSGKTIYGKILKSLKKEKQVSVVYDQMISPTYTYDISRAISIVLKENLTGIFHVAPKKSLSPYDFASIIAKKNNISEKKIRKVKLNDYYDRDAARLRLKNAILDGKKTNKILGFVPMTPEEAL